MKPGKKVEVALKIFDVFKKKRFSFLIGMEPFGGTYKSEKKYPWLNCFGKKFISHFFFQKIKNAIY